MTRKIGNAVVRNRVKRVPRVKRSEKCLNFVPIGIDLVVIARAKAETLTQQQVQDEWERARSGVAKAVKKAVPIRRSLACSPISLRLARLAVEGPCCASMSSSAEIAVASPPPDSAADSPGSFSYPIGVVARLFLAIIRIYQQTLSKLIALTAGQVCRFEPSCSRYAAACIRDHGAWRGSLLSARRLCKCHPFHAGGFDPPPLPRNWRIYKLNSTRRDHCGEHRWIEAPSFDGWSSLASCWR